MLLNILLTLHNEAMVSVCLAAFCKILLIIECPDDSVPPIIPWSINRERTELLGENVGEGVGINVWQKKNGVGYKLWTWTLGVLICDASFWIYYDKGIKRLIACSYTMRSGCQRLFSASMILTWY